MKSTVLPFLILKSYILLERLCRHPLGSSRLRSSGRPVVSHLNADQREKDQRIQRLGSLGAGGFATPVIMGVGLCGNRLWVAN